MNSNMSFYCTADKLKDSYDSRAPENFRFGKAQTRWGFSFDMMDIYPMQSERLFPWLVSINTLIHVGSLYICHFLSRIIIFVVIVQSYRTFCYGQHHYNRIHIQCHPDHIFPLIALTSWTGKSCKYFRLSFARDLINVMMAWWYRDSLTL